VEISIRCSGAGWNLEDETRRIRLGPSERDGPGLLQAQWPGPGGRRARHAPHASRSGSASGSGEFELGLRLTPARALIRADCWWKSARAVAAGWCRPAWHWLAAALANSQRVKQRFAQLQPVAGPKVEQLSATAASPRGAIDATGQRPNAEPWQGAGEPCGSRQPPLMTDWPERSFHRRCSYTGVKWNKRRPGDQGAQQRSRRLPRAESTPSCFASGLSACSIQQWVRLKRAGPADARGGEEASRNGAQHVDFRAHRHVFRRAPAAAPPSRLASGAWGPDGMAADACRCCKQQGPGCHDAIFRQGAKPPSRPGAHRPAAGLPMQRRLLLLPAVVVVRCGVAAPGAGLREGQNQLHALRPMEQRCPAA